MKILFINGSPRGEKGSSSFPILKDLAGVITEVHENFEQNFLTLPRSMKGDPAPVLKQMEEADIWVFAMPLYVDTLPSHVLRWLMEYQKSRTPESLSRRVYAVVNSGFPEPEQRSE
ncbi:MAG: NAD(P)H-dependent oxidoreductase, partial [Spirochaetales bacterium]|nr:NAD(P)H-dependent oxidoreductase [Spirochaetales bacterium]